MKKEVQALLDKNVPLISNLANTASFLYESLEDINWVGFYLVDEEKKYLYLGPFMGPIACTIIDFNKGICGQSYREKRTVIVDNVHLVPFHIACSGATNSEIVIPIIKDNKVYGVLDIDSPLLNRFSHELENQELNDIANLISELF